MSTPSNPSYLHLAETGALEKIVKKLNTLLRSCTICPRACKADRISNELGFCRVGRLPMISSYAPHFGEEKPLVGVGGSGTIFMTHCNLRCLYCQNFEISQIGSGREYKLEELADCMLYLQGVGCHNINFVTPTHVLPQIVEALSLAVDKGLTIPLVYNCGGYESVDTLRLVNGIFDIYMPDIKYADAQIALELSRVDNYPETAKTAVQEMHRQVGDLVIDERGLAVRGLLVRHLVLPAGLSGSRQILDFIANKISRHTYINIMDQYHPCYKAFEHAQLSRTVEARELRQVFHAAHLHGLDRIDAVGRYRPLEDCRSK